MKKLVRQFSESPSLFLLSGCIAERRRATWGPAIVVLISCFLYAVSSHANDLEVTPVANYFKDGSRHFGMLAGYGTGFRMGSKEDRESSRELAGVRLVEFIPRIGFGMTDRLGGDAWYAGNIETLYEGALFHNTAQNGGYGIGLGTTLRYNFIFSDKVVPFIDANFGIISLNLDLERQSDGFNFNIGFGGGAHWFVSDNMAITTEIRWQHISNAKTKLPNDGINAGLFLLGFSYFFADSE
jgi:opacity protein-like surface antigen